MMSLNPSTAPAAARGDPVQPALQRLGEFSDQDLYDRLVGVGFFPDHEERPVAMALIGLAIRLEPGLLVMRFVDALPSGDEPLSIAELCNTLARLNHVYTTLETTPKAIDPRLGTCLVLNDAAMILTHVQNDAGISVAALIDPTTGEMLSAKDAPDLFSQRSRILVFQRPEEAGSFDKPGLRHPGDQSWFSSVFKRLGGTIWLLMFIGFVLTATAMSVPIFIMLIFDQVVGPQSPDPFVSIAAGGAAVVLAEVLLRAVRVTALSSLASRLDYLVGTGLFEKLLALPPRVAEQVPISSHIARIRTFESVRDFFSGPILVSVLGIPATLFALLVIYLLAGKLVLVSMVVIATYLLLAPLLWRRVALAIEDAAIEGSAAQRFTLETFQKLPSIQRDGLASKWMEKYRLLSGSSTASQYRLHMLGQTCETIGGLVSGLGILCTLWIGTNLVWDAQLSVGGLIAVTMLTWTTVFPFHSLLSLLPRFEQSRKSIKQINLFMDSHLDEDHEEGDIPAPSLRGEVEFAGVAIRYSKGAGPVFAGLSLTIKPGQLVAVTGPNGAGKSSVLKLAAGLLSPMIGAVRLDGLDARQLNPRDLRRRIAYVPQSVSLFHGTIAENLRFANRLAEDIELWSALDLVGARAQVEAMDDGLATELTPRGSGFSGLLVQRIALARAILQNSQLIVIDERPSSDLRAGLDTDLKDMLRKLQGQRTIIMASHRADFIRLADKAIALRPGQTPVIGSPDKIMDLLK